MRIVPFKQVDVFTGVPFRGNPVAVVLDAEGLEASEMQRIANWTNLSETTFVLPPTQMMSVALAKALGTTIDAEPAPRAINVGPTWLIVDLDAAENVRKLKPDMAKLAEVNRDFGGVGVTVFGRTGDELTPLVVRSFCPGDAVPEDPVCGSGNAAVAAFLRDYGLIEGDDVRYVASQGREIGRDGLVHVRVTRDGDIEIGGRAVTVVDGGIRL
jgi:PhzF family phenazine biosynthesis protein